MENKKYMKFIRLIIALIIIFSIANLSYSSDFVRRIAVLQFDDHSNFDSPTGCGFLPKWPFNILFGDKSIGEKWDLKNGIPSMLTEHLDQKAYYKSISQSELLDTMAVLNLSRKKLKKSEESRAKLAEELELDALIIGDIREFGQQRIRGAASRRYAQSGGDGTVGGFTGGISAKGYYYSATVEIELFIYGHSGRPVSKPTVKSTERYELGGTNVGPVKAVISNKGSTVQIGNKKVVKEKVKPIVEQDKLRQIKFGSEKYKKTLLGIVTVQVLDQTVEHLRKAIGPSDSQIAKPAHPVSGKIASIDSDDPSETYINLGSQHDIVPGHKLAVYKSVEISDPDTGEVLGDTYKKIGLIEVTNVISDRLSKAKILKGFGEIEKGNLVDNKFGN